MENNILPNWIKMNSNWTIDAPIEYRQWGMVKIYQETVRKLFLVGIVEIGIEADDCSIPQILHQKLLRFFVKRLSVEFTRFLQEIAQDAVKIGSDPELLTNNLIASGYLAKWTRLAKDGVSIVSIWIGPGRLLEKALENQRQTNTNQTIQWILEQKKRLELLKKHPQANLSKTQRLGVIKILERVTGALKELEDFYDYNSEQPVLLYGDSWSRFSPNKIPNGFTLGVEFLLSLCNVLFLNTEGFEWKEIGATTYEKIGGSKCFDTSKDILIKITETISNTALSDIGLLSNGSLYPIYLAGNYRIFYSDGTEENRSRSGLYSITNVQVQEIESINLPGEVVICTENRALLLKMYKSRWLEDSKVLAIGIDGQVKSAHELFLGLLKQTKLKFYIWPDTDNAGMIIAKKLKNIVPDAKLVFVDYQNKNILTTPGYSEWAAALSSNISFKDREQENFLGESKLWDKVFKI